jgi:RimJ/RimL family protein N-acetyltransferase
MHVWTLRDGTPIGHGGVWFPRIWPEPEFGWTLWRGTYEGRGLASEAMRRLMTWAWTGLGLSTAVAYITAGNLASERVAQRLGGWHDTGARTPDATPTQVYRFAQGALA